MRYFRLGLYAIAMFACMSATSVQANVDPQQVVREAADRVIHALEGGGDHIRKSPDQIYNLVDQHVLPLFDFERMSYYILGRYWKEASEVQKAGFMQEFKHLLVDTYATALSEYTSEEEIIYHPTQVSKNADVVTVPTEIRQKGSPPVEVSYRMYRSNDVWRIFDVAIGGISLVTNYRANFSGEIRKSGLDGLIKTMSEHNSKLNSAGQTTAGK